MLFDWESGRRQPTAAKAFNVANAAGVDLGASLARFLRRSVGARPPYALTTPAGVRELLIELRGTTRFVELAERSGFNRFSISRWFKGPAQPTLAEFLAILDATTLRLVDFVAAVADARRVPMVRGAWEQLERARALAYDAPWSHVVLRALELADYQALPSHVTGFLAKRLGISESEERRYLTLLADAGQIQQRNGRWVPAEAGVVDTRVDPERSRLVRAFWSEMAATRIRAGASGEFSFNLFGVSSRDLERITRLQHAYFAELRRIVAASEPVERVVLTNLQLFPLDEV